MGKLKDTICYDSPVSYYDHELRAGVDKWEYPERRDNLLLEFTITEMFAASKFAIARVRVTREQGDQEFYWSDRVVLWFGRRGKVEKGFRFSEITPPHECYVGMLEELDQKLGVVLRKAAEEIERRTRKFVNETTEDAVDNAIYQERNK